jgi:hypothetical protein
MSRDNVAQVTTKEAQQTTSSIFHEPSAAPLSVAFLSLFSVQPGGRCVKIEFAALTEVVELSCTQAAGRHLV